MGGSAMSMMLRSLPLIACLGIATSYTPPARTPGCKCNFTSTKGATLDLANLKSITETSPATVSDRIQKAPLSDYMYTFGVCNNVQAPKNCLDSTGAPVKRDYYWAPGWQTKKSENALTPAQGTPYCRYLGNPAMMSNMEWALYDEEDPSKGVKMTYTGGESCSTKDASGNPQRRQLELNFLCSRNQLEKFEDQVLDETGHCKYAITVESEYACPLECGFGSSGNICNNHGICRYDTDLKKAKCFCNDGWEGGGCEATSDGDDDKPTYGPVLGLLIFVTVALVALVAAMVFLWRYLKGRMFNTPDQPDYSRMGGQGGLVENSGRGMNLGAGAAGL